MSVAVKIYGCSDDENCRYSSTLLLDVPEGTKISCVEDE